jgi:hypothetical protein
MTSRVSVSSFLPFWLRGPRPPIASLSLRMVECRHDRRTCSSWPSVGSLPAESAPNAAAALTRTSRDGPRDSCSSRSSNGEYFFSFFRWPQQERRRPIVCYVISRESRSSCCVRNILTTWMPPPSRRRKLVRYPSTSSRNDHQSDDEHEGKHKVRWTRQVEEIEGSTRESSPEPSNESSDAFKVDQV